MKRNDELADRASAEAEIETLANTGEVLEIEAETGEEQGGEPGKEEEKPAEVKADTVRKPGF
jgi:hypothetical protein